MVGWDKMMDENWKIWLQADDFFNAYKALKEHGDNVSLSTMGPTIVSLAFATEHYVKNLYSILNLKPKKPTHNILDLYNELPEETKYNIFSHKVFSQRLPILRSSTLACVTHSASSSDFDIFIQHLGTISDAFEKWRYSYEHSTLHYNEWFALDFIEAVKSTTDKTCAEPLTLNKRDDVQMK